MALLRSLGVGTDPDVNVMVAVCWTEMPSVESIANTVTVPGLDQAAAEKVVESAHQVCPYSNATRGNIEVKLTAHGGKG